MFATLLRENFFGYADGSDRVWPAGVKRQVSDGFDQLSLRRAVLARPDEVRPELVRTVQGNQRGTVTRLHMFLCQAGFRVFVLIACRSPIGPTV